MKVAALIAGWMLTIVGGIVASVFGFMFLIWMCLGPYGWIYGLFVAGPLGSLGIVVFYFGRSFVKFVQKREGMNDLNYSAPPYPPSYLLPAKKEPS